MTAKETIRYHSDIETDNTKWIKNYANIFANRWIPYLNDDETMRADVHIDASGNMLAFEFYLADITDKWDLIPKSNTWNYILEEINKIPTKPIEASQMPPKGETYAISNDLIIIVKRNEKRLWSRWRSRKDAMYTLWKSMYDTMPESWFK